MAKKSYINKNNSLAASDEESISNKEFRLDKLPW